MGEDKRKFNIFILGAGFSRPAGLPLGDELFAEILKQAKTSVIYDNILKKDIEYFLSYKREVDGVSLNEELINFEEFVSYLDLEHYLLLRGSDTWSEEGNRSQLAIRYLLGQILFDRTIEGNMKNIKLYDSFIEKLLPGDIIITFNYDTILENRFKAAEKQFRLIWDSDSPFSDKDVIILKMHGSIDWFDYGRYEVMINGFKEQPYHTLPKHIIFSNPDLFKPTKITGSFGPNNHSLSRFYHIDNLDRYYNGNPQVIDCPFIISPSFNKLVYMNLFREFWYGFNNAGALNTTVAIIGLSLAYHDDYIKLPLYNLIDNFQNYDPGIIKKSKLKIVDFKQSNEEIENFKKRYSFVNWEQTDFYTNGFNEEAIEMIFNH